MNKKKFASFFLFASLALVACTNHNNQQPKIRIVDLNGKPHSIITKAPELNSQYTTPKDIVAIPSQQNPGSIDAKINANSPYANQPSTQNAGAAQNKNFASNSSEIISQTFQSTYSSPAENKAEDQVVQYNLGSQSETTINTAAATKSAKKSRLKKLKKVTTRQDFEQDTTKKEGFYAQVGSFANHDSASKRLEEMQKFYQGIIETTEGKKTLYRVLLGPFKDRKKATNLVKKINDAGHEAILVK